MAESRYVKVERISGVAVGEVLREKVTEHENTPVFAELQAAAASCANRLVVDLKGVGLLSSAGLGAMITLHKACAAAGGKLVVCGLQPQILELLKLTHLHRLITIADTREAAIQKAGV